MKQPTPQTCIDKVRVAPPSRGSLIAVSAGGVVAACGFVLLWLAVSSLWYTSHTFVEWQPPAKAGERDMDLEVAIREAGWTERTAESVDLKGKGDRLNSADMDRFRSLGDSNSETSGDDEIPKTERWQIFFPQGLSQGPYARQLDALGIELGVVQNDGNIQYLSEISKQQPRKRTGRMQDERRLYLSWSRGDLREADRALCSNAGINTNDTIILRFCPPHTEQEMVRLENKYAGRRPQEIRLTRFALKRTINGYRLFVLDQLSR